jgi:hypothetical protein
MSVDIVKLGTEVIAGASILHTLLPPWDFLNDFPTLQKYYKLVVYVIGYVALNARSTLYQNISVNNPSGPNANAPAPPPTPPAGGN